GVELAEAATGAREIEVRIGWVSHVASSTWTSACSTAASCASMPRFTSPKRLSMTQPASGRPASSTRSISLTASSDARRSGSRSRRNASRRGGTRMVMRSRSTIRRTAARMRPSQISGRAPLAVPGSASATGTAPSSSGRKTDASGAPASGANVASDKGVLPAPAERDLLLLLEAADDADDVRLRLLDVLQPHRSHAAHVLLQDLRRALRDVAEDLVAHRRARGLEGEHQVLARDLLEHHLHAAVVEADQVLEREHEVPDAVGDVGHVGLELREDARLELAVGAVQDLGGELRSFELAAAVQPLEP